MKMARAFAGIMMVVLSAFSVKAANGLDRVLSQMESKEQKLSAIRFDFVQQVYFVQMNQTSEVRGEALFAKGGKFRLSKTFPDQQLTISDGKKLWMYNPSAQQVWQSEKKDWFSSSTLPQGIVPLDHYVRDLKARFDLAVSQEKDGRVVLTAIPKDSILGYRLTLIVSTATWLPVETTYESESARVITSLTSVMENPPVTSKTFVFVAPPKTEIIPLN